jgi:hypothetical protein
MRPLRHELRNTALLDLANQQIGGLVELLSTRDHEVLRLPCPGREKLGDGSIGATAGHVADIYQRLGGFVRANTNQTAALTNAQPGHRGRTHTHPHEHVAGELQGLLQQLAGALATLAPLTELTDEQLDSISPADSFRFCDGKRSLERVIAGVLNHQRHHVDVLEGALS